VLDQIPGIADAFSHQSFGRARTELVLFIRPSVIRYPIDGSVIS
jgi:general secretion pathway protein D